MTKEKIKEALRCCKNQCCSYCPHWCEKGCQYQTLSNALDLITEQEKEIEKKGQIIENLNGLIDYADKEIRKLKAEKKQAQIDTINTIVKYCENPNHWRELKDCKLWGGKSDDLRNFLSGIFKEIKEQ